MSCRNLQAQRAAPYIAAAARGRPRARPAPPFAFRRPTRRGAPALKCPSWTSSVAGGRTRAPRPRTVTASRRHQNTGLGPAIKMSVDT
ncbi:hypothetical protein EVAR_65836_1 [Eumeta japonica]|uniref:Uncharacterized protein n=1 Tax=Eumeta variegata TaxID=151549 RepID=A0A4C1ZNP1_EUMVA|nr:hypothetical protein EVAR_65836_1 [Eumeta japonica]